MKPTPAQNDNNTVSTPKVTPPSVTTPAVTTPTVSAPGDADHAVDPGRPDGAVGLDSDGDRAHGQHP